MRATLFVLFLAVLALAALPLGSNRPWSWNLLAAALGGLTAAWGLLALVRPRVVNAALPAGLVALFLGVVGWAGVQAWSGTPPEWHHPLWTVSAEVQARVANTGPGTSARAGARGDEGSDPAAHAAISLAPDDTLTALMRLLSYGLAFFLAFQLCREAGQARGLFRALAGIGLLGSVYGLYSYWGGPEGHRFLFFWEMDWRPAVHGTFVNRNHFATWLGLCLLCLLALFHDAVAVKRRNPAYQLPGQHEVRLEDFLARAWPYLAALIVMTAALILTHSRGGFLATVAGGVTLLVLLDRRQRTGTTRSRAALAAAVAVSLAAFFITSEVLLERFDRTSPAAEGRLLAFELTREGIGDSPLLGFGYGTFADSFRLYRDEALEGFFDKTHNTYLENLFELGWPAALALFACVGWAALICLRGVRARGRDWVYPATGVAATVLVGSHALVDFSLQIPATAVTYAALLGAAVAQSFSSRR